MANYLKQTPDIPVLGSDATPVALLSSYDSTKSAVIAIGKAEHVTLIVGYKMGAAETGNSIQLKYEFSSDGVTYARNTLVADSGGTRTISLREDTFSATQSAETYDYFQIDFVDVCAKSMKVWAKETGVSSNAGSFYIVGITGGR